MCEDVKDILIKLMTSSEKEFFNYLKQQEIKETKIHQKISDTIALTEIVKSRREVFELMSREFFKERENLYNMAIQSLDVAIIKGDEELAERILLFISAIYSKKYIRQEI